MKRIYYEYKPDEGASVIVYSPDFDERELPYLVALKKTQASPITWVVIGEYASPADVIRQAIRLLDSLDKVGGA